MVDFEVLLALVAAILFQDDGQDHDSFLRFHSEAESNVFKLVVPSWHNSHIHKEILYSNDVEK